MSWNRKNWGWHFLIGFWNSCMALTNIIWSIRCVKMVHLFSYRQKLDDQIKLSSSAIICQIRKILKTWSVCRNVSILYINSYIFLWLIINLEHETRNGRNSFVWLWNDGLTLAHCMTSNRGILWFYRQQTGNGMTLPYIFPHHITLKIFWPSKTLWFSWYDSSHSVVTTGTFTSACCILD